MESILTYAPQNVDHLVIGSQIRAYIVYVHDSENLKFSIRVLSPGEFFLTDAIENGQYPLEGYNVSPSNRVFGIGIFGKIYRSVLVPPLGNDAYLIDLGCKIPIGNITPIYRFPLLEQSIPGLAILCKYAGSVNAGKWSAQISEIFQGAVCVLRIVGKENSILLVRLE